MDVGAEPNWLCLGYLLSDAYADAFSIKCCAQGFLMAGIEPFDPDRILGVGEWEKAKERQGLTTVVLSDSEEEEENEEEGRFFDSDSESDDEEAPPTGAAQNERQREVVAEWNKDKQAYDVLFKIPTEHSKLTAELKAEWKNKDRQVKDGGIALDAEGGGGLLAERNRAREAAVEMKELEKEERAKARAVKKATKQANKEAEKLARQREKEDKRREALDDLVSKHFDAAIDLIKRNDCDVAACSSKLTVPELLAVIYKLTGRLIDSNTRKPTLVDSTQEAVNAMPDRGADVEGEGQ